MNQFERFVEHPKGKLFVASWQPDPVAPSGSANVPFLLLHDSLGCVGLWRDFPDRLAQTLGVPVHAYDRLGYGRSSARNGPQPLSFIADEAQAGIVPVLDALAIDRCVLLGHSVGGAMALTAAAIHPERVAGVVTIAAQAFVEQRTLEGIRAAKALFAHPEQRARLTRWHGAKAQWVLDAWTETWLDSAFRDWSLVSVLPKVTAPVLAIHGDRDEYGSEVFPNAIAAGVVGPAEQVILRDCGHLPHRERPDEVMTAITAWFRRRLA
ncbi:alpha/beta fold hydrolase [Hydrogenophilus thermoluteolus]|uniref:Alpha/beta hydrolase n=1 Tax=Hydrogenophilus thermoluteolus TaxID=297 RepID=A0A2Z6DYA0_HYDTE|nr:alpha/beta hydrolase [Hydrogenophilus thermoluteolus]BBD77506.1 alpha/beta hydrolase [Hydrogenophilus thermoluteolus]